jgi:hypothetical protein
MLPVPEGFKNLDSYPAAGMRVNRSLDRKAVAIQFSEDWRASRNGLKSEIDTLEIEGFRYSPPGASGSEKTPSNRQPTPWTPSGWERTWPARGSGGRSRRRPPSDRSRHPIRAAPHRWDTARMGQSGHVRQMNT